MNPFRYYFSRLHRNQDFEQLLNGIFVLVANPVNSSNTYLPKSMKQIQFTEELIMLLWKWIEFNPVYSIFNSNIVFIRDFLPMYVRMKNL